MIDVLPVLKHTLCRPILGYTLSRAWHNLLYKALSWVHAHVPYSANELESTVFI